MTDFVSLAPHFEGIGLLPTHSHQHCVRVVLRDVSVYGRVLELAHLFQLKELYPEICGIEVPS